MSQAKTCQILNTEPDPGRHSGAMHDGAKSKIRRVCLDRPPAVSDAQEISNIYALAQCCRSIRLQAQINLRLHTDRIAGRLRYKIC